MPRSKKGSKKSSKKGSKKGRKKTSRGSGFIVMGVDKSNLCAYIVEQLRGQLVLGVNAMGADVSHSGYVWGTTIVQNTVGIDPASSVAIIPLQDYDMVLGAEMMIAAMTEAHGAGVRAVVLESVMFADRSGATYKHLSKVEEFARRNFSIYKVVRTPFILENWIDWESTILLFTGDASGSFPYIGVEDAAEIFVSAAMASSGIRDGRRWASERESNALAGIATVSDVAEAFEKRFQTTSFSKGINNYIDTVRRGVEGPPTGISFTKLFGRPPATYDKIAADLLGPKKKGKRSSSKSRKSSSSSRDEYSDYGGEYGGEYSDEGEYSAE